MRGGPARHMQLKRNKTREDDAQRRRQRSRGAVPDRLRLNACDSPFLSRTLGASTAAVVALRSLQERQSAGISITTVDYEMTMSALLYQDEFAALQAYHEVYSHTLDAAWIISRYTEFASICVRRDVLLGKAMMLRCEFSRCFYVSGDIEAMRFTNVDQVRLAGHVIAGARSVMHLPELLLALPQHKHRTYRTILSTPYPRVARSVRLRLAALGIFMRICKRCRDLPRERVAELVRIFESANGSRAAIHGTPELREFAYMTGELAVRWSIYVECKRAEIGLPPRRGFEAASRWLVSDIEPTGIILQQRN